MVQLGGLHHVTAFATDPQRNLDFYRNVLGLRLVKLTVNFDQPQAYHLYFGNTLGEPGTVLTFFPWPNMQPGELGSGQVSAVAFSVPAGCLGAWNERMKQLNYTTYASTRFGQEVLALTDPDGLRLELIATLEDGPAPFEPGMGITEEMAIRGFHSISLLEEGFEATAQVLQTRLAYQPADAHFNRYRFTHESAAFARHVDVICAPGTMRGSLRAGSVHHVAFRAATAAAQQALREQLVTDGVNVTPVLDRKYFTAIYFREPGGVLFEVATDAPGFTVDEPAEQLGTGLQFPEALLDQAEELKAKLPPLNL